MNATEHNPLVETPNLAVTQLQTPTQAAMSPAPKLGALASVQLHWPEYLMEAGLLGAFMVSACVFGALYEFPQSPVHQAIMSRMLRRLLMGMSMGLTAIAIIYSPWGNQSGAHINPSVTFTFFRLGKIKAWDALFYITAQFTGAVLGVLLVARFLGQRTFRSGSALRRYLARPGWTVGGPLRGIHHRFHSDVRGPLFFQSPPSLALYRAFCRPAGRHLHHPRGAVLRHEYESRSNFWLGLPSHDLGRTVDLPDRAAAGHARSGGDLPLAKRTHCCEVLQTSPRQRQALHILRSQWRIRIMTDNRYDVIIIGTGAGGGTLAYHLAPSGKRILILERGDYVPREKDNWDPQVVNVDAQYNTKESWLDKDGKELHPHTNYYVGGNTKFYGAALFRLRKEDFGELRHHGGISPAWPISYDDLEPYYTQAENLYHVHGKRGEDPTEPPASAPYPCIRPSATSRAFSSSPTTSRARG